MSPQQPGFKQVKKVPRASVFSPGGVSSSLSPTFLSSRKRSAKSCSLFRLPLPQDIDSNLGYQVPEFPPQYYVPLSWALPFESFLKTQIFTLEETDSP